MITIRFIPLLAVAMMGCSASPSVPGSKASDASASTVLRAAPSVAPTAPALPVAQSPPGTDGSACWFAWRPNDQTDFVKKHRRVVRLSNAGDRDRFALGGFDIAVVTSRGPTGGVDLDLQASTSSTVLQDHFTLGPTLTAGHLPLGGHGYTGLRYVRGAHGSELNYWCGSVSQTDDVTDDAVSQRRPGPSAPGDAFVRCTVSGDGNAKVAEVGRTRRDEQVDLSFASVVVATSYMPGWKETGSLGTLATLGSGEAIHDVVQLSGTDLPSNTFPDGSFTGVRTIKEVGTGRTLTYRCSTHR